MRKKLQLMCSCTLWEIEGFLFLLILESFQNKRCDQIAVQLIIQLKPIETFEVKLDPLPEAFGISPPVFVWGMTTRDKVNSQFGTHALFISTFPVDFNTPHTRV